MLTYEQALAVIRAAGVPTRNAHVTNGDPDDYGVHQLSWAGNHPRHALEAAERVWQDKAAHMSEHPSEYPRRWLHCETGAGLAEDEHGEIADYPNGRTLLERSGWEYTGSAGYRVEIDPASIHQGYDPYLPGALVTHL